MNKILCRNLMYRIENIILFSSIQEYCAIKQRTQHSWVFYKPWFMTDVKGSRITSSANGGVKIRNAHPSYSRARVKTFFRAVGKLLKIDVHWYSCDIYVWQIYEGDSFKKLYDELWCWRFVKLEMKIWRIRDGKCACFNFIVPSVESNMHNRHCPSVSKYRKTSL